MLKPTIIALFEADRYRFTALMREFTSMGFVWINSMQDKSKGLMGHFVHFRNSK